MDKLTIRIYYDFASTLCYVGHRVMLQVLDEVESLGIELQWRPIDLTEAAPWSRGDSFASEVRDSVHNTAQALGIAVEMPDPWLDSRPASQIALSAPTAEIEARWRTAVFDTFFVQQRPEITPQLATLARDLVGMDSVPMVEEDFDLVKESTEEAIALGINGVPTLLLDHWTVGGVFDPPTMVSVLEQLVEKYREVGTSTVN